MKLNNLRLTIRVAQIELNTMFYSPVAWFVLVVFAFQVGLSFSTAINANLYSVAMGYDLYNITYGLFSGLRGLFPAVTQYLYLYIPLVSMGLLSREYQSGSIKLLYSSPVNNSSIVLGKFIAIVSYGMAMMAIILLYITFTLLVVDNADWAFMMTGFLGIFLLMLAYSAIGLFMSSLTSYQVVAAIGTLALLGVLNYIGLVGQDIAFVREITYWLSISGRAFGFIEGFISSESVIYFMVIISLFVILTIMKLDSERTHRGVTNSILRYSLVVLAALGIGFVSSRAQFKIYYDAIFTKDNTLSNESQQVLSRLNGGMKITTYVNILDADFLAAVPKAVKTDMSRFDHYFRFKPEIEMDYVYYYDQTNNPGLANLGDLDNEGRAKKLCEINDINFNLLLTPEQVKKKIDLSTEGNRFVRVIEREDGSTIRLRLFADMEKHPQESEITAALKRFVEKSPVVAFVTGHGDRTIQNSGSRGYNTFAQNKGFRNSLFNQGFTPIEVNLAVEEISDSVDIVIVADLQSQLSDMELTRLNSYIERGGNMFILADENRQESMNHIVEPLGVKLLDNVLVQPRKESNPTMVMAGFTEESTKIFPSYVPMRQYGYRIAMPTSLAMVYDKVTDFTVTPVLVTEVEGVWLERETKDFEEEALTLNPLAGEREESFVTLIAMHRSVNGKEQRIIVSGDADCISNAILQSEKSLGASNFSIITGSFRWLSHDKFPIMTEHIAAIDNVLKVTPDSRTYIKLGAMWIVPLLLLSFGIVIMMRRKRG